MKKAIWLLTVFCILFSLAACSKRQTRVRPVVVYEKSGDTKDIVLENNFLRLRFMPKTAGIVLTDKSTGVEWYSNPWGDREPNDPMSDYITMQLMQSQFALQYADVTGVGMTLYSKEQSVERNAFNYAIVDGGLEVNYTVGNLARVYIIPPAAPEERIRYFLDKMDPDDRRRVEATYRLYDINNLREGDDRGALLSMYPDLSRTKIYIIRESSQEWMKEQVEGFFAGAGYTYDDYFEDVTRYPSTGGDDKPAFNITMRYTLDGKSLVLSVPFDKIAYRAAYPITTLTLMPYMGAGGINDEGYLFVPDGSGALIYFNNGKQNQVPYNNSMYGWNEAMPREAIVIDNRAPYPVFGIQKNGSAMLCVIEEGSAYASVQADVSRRNSSWNTVYTWFSMVHSAKMDISGRSERMVYLYENGLPSGENITLRYTLCADDGYVGMAKEYRSWLLRKYPEMGNKKEGGLPVAVEIVGAVNKTQHRLGIPFDLPLKLSSYKEAEDMIRNIAELGWKNVRVKLTGWFNRSVDHSVPARIKLIKQLGSRKNFENLVSTAENSGYDVFPEVDFVYMRGVRPFGGFNIYRDAARYVNRKRVEKYPYSFVWFGERIRWGKLSYLARPAYTMSAIDGFKQKAGNFGLKNIAFRNIGAKLAGDYNEKRHVSREASMIMRQEKLAQLAGSGTGLLVQTGYAYTAPWATFITDIAIDDQEFGITDVSVPFYQMVLHGLVPYTGRAINLAEDYMHNLLKTIEGGGGLYFSFMKEETAVLQETKFRQFYSNEYDKWIGDANALYQKFSVDFAGLYSQAIVNHIILSPEVTVTVYEDGTRVIVNRSDNVWNYNGAVIRANDYLVLR